MYEQQTAASLYQGDILDECPILIWKLQPPPLHLVRMIHRGER